MDAFLVGLAVQKAAAQIELVRVGNARVLASRCEFGCCKLEL